MNTQRQHYDFIVIGSGPAGQKAAIQGTKAGMKVLMIEKDRNVGGACVHRGTIPSKTLRETTIILNRFRDKTQGVVEYKMPTHVTIKSLISSVGRVVDGHVKFMDDQLGRNNVEIVLGKARFVGENEVEIRSPGGGETRVSGDFIFIATGSTPRRPPEVPIDHEHIFDSDSILSMTYLPESLCVLGGGVIATEYATIFAALGVKVTMIDRGQRPVGFLDHELPERLLQMFEHNGGRFIPGDSAETVSWNGFDAVTVTTKNGEKFASEKLLCALGRVASLGGLGLENIGLTPTDRGVLAVDVSCQTAIPNIYAVGDVIGPPSLASSSMEQGRRAACHALGMSQGTAGDLIPAGIYAIPEMSTIGLTEEQAREEHGDVIIGRARFEEMARGQISGDTGGLLKLVADPTGETILGVHIVGEGATELIHVGQMGLMSGLGVDVFRDNIFNFPTLVEGYRVAALEIAGKRAQKQELGESGSASGTHGQRAA